jgi:hypothetical protein
MCYQKHNCRRYDFGHTLLCYLGHTYMFNKPTSGLSMVKLIYLNESFCLAAALGVAKFTTIIDVNFVTLSYPN